MGVNDDAWRALFDRYHILDEIHQNGRYTISADQIREYREPRLMTKFDHKSNLPKVFEENDLSILPITRGDYVVSSFDAYQNFEEPSDEVQRISLPTHLQSLAPHFIVSEAIALNCAHACGILNDFLEDDELVSTVSGRMGSGSFEFHIDTNDGAQNISVINSQIEIDAAYEGINYLSLFEAKRDLSDDFLIRQLYYPYRVWRNRVTKQVKSVFLVFSNGVFRLYQYQFDDPSNYNSLHLLKQKNYAIATQISLADIENLIRTVPVVQEPRVPFPQANDMLRIINLAELLFEGPMLKHEITDEYSFTERQAYYYADAGRYLELIDRGSDDEGNPVYKLSALGQRIMAMEYRERQLAIATQIIKHTIFKETLRLHLQHGEMPDTAAIVRIMKETNIYGVEADSTFRRRASTITNWVNWILSIVDE